MVESGLISGTQGAGIAALRGPASPVRGIVVGGVVVRGAEAGATPLPGTAGILGVARVRGTMARGTAGRGTAAALQDGFREHFEESSQRQEKVASPSVGPSPSAISNAIVKPAVEATSGRAERLVPVTSETPMKLGLQKPFAGRGSAEEPGAEQAVTQKPTAAGEGADSLVKPRAERVRATEAGLTPGSDAALPVARKQPSPIEPSLQAATFAAGVKDEESSDLACASQHASATKDGLAPAEAGPNRKLATPSAASPDPGVGGMMADGGTQTKLGINVPAALPKGASQASAAGEAPAQERSAPVGVGATVKPSGAILPKPAQNATADTKIEAAGKTTSETRVPAKTNSDTKIDASAEAGPSKASTGLTRQPEESKPGSKVEAKNGKQIQALRHTSGEKGAKRTAEDAASAPLPANPAPNVEGGPVAAPSAGSPNAVATAAASGLGTEGQNQVAASVPVVAQSLGLTASPRVTPAPNASMSPVEGGAAKGVPAAATQGARLDVPAGSVAKAEKGTANGGEKTDGVPPGPRAGSEILQTVHAGPNATANQVQAHAPGLGDARPGTSSSSTHEVGARAPVEASAANVEAREHTTLVATPKVLEVGIASGTNGWLRVRAEMDGTGQVSAAVVANSSTAAEALHKELPALSAYLASESLGVSSLVVNRAEGSAMEQDAGMSFGPGTGAGADPGQGRQGGEGNLFSANGATPEQAVSRADESGASLRGAGVDLSGTALPVRSFGRESGGWLNVVA